MKTYTTFLATIMFFAASCGTRSNDATNADHYGSNDSSAITKQPADTFKTTGESATNGPDNAPPNANDSGVKVNGPNYRGKARAASNNNSTEQSKVPQKVGH